MHTQPSLAELIEDYRSGRLDPDEWVASRKRHVVREVAALLDSRGDPVRLAALLHRDWRLLFHPAVCRLLLRLWAPTGRPRSGTRAGRAASEQGDTLRRLIEGWVQGVLPGARLTAPRHSGAPRDSARRGLIVRDYEDLRRRLQAYDASAAPRESQGEWTRRWREVLRVVWAESDLAAYTYVITDPRSGRRVVREVTAPLPGRRLGTWLATARRRLAKGQSLHDYLAACLAAHRWGLRPRGLRAPRKAPPHREEAPRGR